MASKSLPLSYPMLTLVRDILVSLINLDDRKTLLHNDRSRNIFAWVVNLYTKEGKKKIMSNIILIASNYEDNKTT